MENIKSETTGQKHISTLATDIKHLIANISNGKPANMTEENMNVFIFVLFSLSLSSFSSRMHRSRGRVHWNNK